MESVTPEINLLPSEDLEKAPIGHFLKWSLTAGRYIVIITELIVLLAFLSRFKLDRDLSDLSESITRKKNIVLASEPFENSVRQLQNRLASVNTIETQAISPEQFLPLINKVLPTEATVDKVVINNHAITLSGMVSSEAGLGTLVDDLKKSNLVSDVSINNIQQQEDGKTLAFSVSVTLWH